jgi:hypothetical protein
MSIKNSDQLYTDLLHKDRIGKPDEAIENRLMYSFMLKSSFLKSRQNSFASFFGWLLSTQSIGLKTALVSVLLFISLMNNQINNNSGNITGNDSLLTKRVLVADSTRVIQNIDSIRTDSLN